MKAALITLGIILAAVFVMILYACIVLARSCDELEESMRNQIVREEVDSDAVIEGELGRSQVQ